MAEKATKEKVIKISVRLSEADYQMTQELMQDLEIPTVSALTRELLREAYFSFRYAKQHDQKDGDDDKAVM